MGKTFLVREIIKCPCGKILQVEIPVYVHALSPYGASLQRDYERKVVVIEIKEDGK